MVCSCWCLQVQVHCVQEPLGVRIKKNTNCYRSVSDDNIWSWFILQFDFVLWGYSFPKMLGLYDQSGQLMSTYLFWLGIFGISFPFGVTIDALFVAMGNTRTPLLLQILSTILNAFLNWLLIFIFNGGF